MLKILDGLEADRMSSTIELSQGMKLMIIQGRSKMTEEEKLRDNNLRGIARSKWKRWRGEDPGIRKRWSARSIPRPS